MKFIKRTVIFSFFCGFIVGIFLEAIYTLEEDSIKPEENVWKNQSLTMKDVKKIRILCFLNSMPKSHYKRAMNILNTWGRHCDKLLFASTVTDLNVGAIGFNVTDDHDHMWGKEKLMLQFIYQHFLDQYDWFLKGDDDTFLIAENLRYLLASYSTEDPIYFGYKFKTIRHKWGYFSGGSGYAMSRNSVRTFVEKVLVNQTFYHEKSWKTGCHIETDKRIEDWDITVCLDYFNVYPGDGRDVLKRERFLMFQPEKHLWAKPDMTNWYWMRKYYWTKEGLDCCSNYTIAFHYIQNYYQYTMYYLTYRLNPYGVIRRFPPPPPVYNFTQVANVLEQEAINKTLRGF